MSVAEVDLAQWLSAGETLQLLHGVPRQDLCLFLPAWAVAQYCCTEWQESEKLVGNLKGGWDSGRKRNKGIDNEMGKIGQ